MKKIYYIIQVALVLLLLATSCDDFIAEEPFAKPATDYIYSTGEGLQTGVNALYNLQRKNNFPADYSQGMKANLFFMVGTDLGMTRTWHSPYGSSAHTPTGFPSEKWTLPYQIIDRANAIIVNARKADIEDKTKNKILAQARTIRAELYFDLFRMYTNILLDTIPTTPENLNDPVVYLPADSTEVFKLINDDLDFAIEHLDWNVPNGVYGKGVACHLRGKSAMWSGDWGRAVEAFDLIINEGPYNLVPIVDVFGPDAGNQEAIYSYYRDKELGGDDDLAGGGGTVLSSVFTNRAYEMSTGEILPSLEQGGTSLGWSYPNDYLQSLYDQESDLRYSTYYFPLTKYVNNPAKPNFGEEISVYDDNFRRHHWSLKKYYDEEKELSTNSSWKDFVYYRFAETLLLGAEAHWRNEGQNSGSIKALEYINRVRARAGLGDFPFTSFDLESYLEESARELAFEKNRWFMLKRMGLLVERQQAHYTMGSNSTNEALFPMEPFHVRLPIPQSQIDLMGTFPQNPGYAL